MVGAFERFRDKFEDEAQRIGESLNQKGAKYLLGHVPHIYSMPASAENVHDPIVKLTCKDGLRRSATKQRDRYADDIKGLSSEVHDHLFALPDPTPSTPAH